MRNNNPPNELPEIFIGFLLVLGLHSLAGLFIFFVLGPIIGSIFGGYTIFVVWLFGAMGFFFWQLVYVLPLVIWLKRRGKIGRMKGVIIAAVLTALVNGACYLSMAR